MRDERRKKEASNVKQTTIRQSNTAHPRQLTFPKKSELPQVHVIHTDNTHSARDSDAAVAHYNSIATFPARLVEIKNCNGLFNKKGN